MMRTTRTRVSAAAIKIDASSAPFAQTSAPEVRRPRKRVRVLGDEETRIDGAGKAIDIVQVKGEETHDYLAPSKRKLQVKKAKVFSKKPINPPGDWETVYAKIKAFREITPAPVDTVGCERLADPLAGPKLFRFQTLVALMLSSQTKDEVTGEAMARLKAKGLSLDSVLTWTAAEIDECICKVGFHRRKALYIKQAAQFIKDRFEGDIPNTIEGLMSLPGVGPKMGYLALQCAWGINDGIGVDVHLHRITNRLGWVKSKEPEETRFALESWLPKKRWREINPMLVGFGQVHCLPRFPKCDTCPVRNLCPSSTAKRTKCEPMSDLSDLD